MNKTVTINLSGLVFQVDEHAYQDLSEYLNAIKARFKNSEGSDEIIADIESRIAEMFSEKLNPKKQVILQADVDEVIAKMGRPEEFEGIDDESGEATNNPSGTKAGSIPKRLFRDPDNKIFGGVCSGISAYFGINDPIWLRLLLVISVLVFGVGGFLYVLLWIIIPKAKTTAEKLSMRGENINISNIEKSIKEEMDDLKDRYGNSGSKHGRRARSAIGDVIDFFISLFKFAFKFILKLVGIELVIVGILMLGATIAAIIFGFGVGGFFFQSWMPVMMDNMWEAILSAVGLLLVAGVPAVGLILLGNRIFNRRPFKRTGLGISLLGLWVAGIIITGVMAVRSAKALAYEEKVREELVLEETDSEIIYLNIARSDLGRNRIYEFFNAQHLVEEGNDYLLRNPEKHNRDNRIKLDIKKSPDNVLSISKLVSANGASRDEAHNRAMGVEYMVEQEDSLITFTDYFRFSQTDGLRGQQLKMTLNLPVGRSVYLHDDMAWIIYDIKNNDKVWDGHMPGHIWTMTGMGLVCQDCAWLKENGNTTEVINEYGHFSSELRDFDEVSVGGAMKVIIEYGEDFDINVIGDKKFMEGIQIEKHGDELIIEPKRGWFNQFRHNNGKVEIVMPSLEAVEFSGASNGKVKGFDEEEMEIEINGASEGDFDLNVGELELTVNGASNAKLKGSGDVLSVEVSGASSLKALEYEVSQVHLDASDASKASVFVTEELNVEVSGASKVKYKGEPKILSDESRFSSIKPIR